MLSSINFAVDSGAHSLYNKSMKGNKGLLAYQRRELDMSEFYSSPYIESYLDSYISFCKGFPGSSFFVSLDVIHNPELTWKFFSRLRKAGVEAMPVLHCGEDPIWASRYLSEGCGYIGLGGLGDDTTDVRDYMGWADKVWERMTKKDDVLCKVHGFALTSIRLMTRYPWASVDSTTWTTRARLGDLTLPSFCKEGEDFSKRFFVPVTQQSRSRKEHISYRGSNVAKRISEYLESLGTSVEEVRDKGEVRDAVNLYHMMQHQDSLNEAKIVPMSIYMSGCFYHSGKIGKVLEKLGKLRPSTSLNYLGTFWNIKYGERVLRTFDTLTPLKKLKRRS